jgi:Sigma-70 factor, region 1.1
MSDNFGLTEAAVDPQRHQERLCCYDQIDALPSPDDVKSEQIEDILAKLTEMGVSVIERGSDTDIMTKAERATSTEPKGESEAANELAVVRRRAVSTTQSAKAPAERTDAPLRIYLRLWRFSLTAPILFAASNPVLTTLLHLVLESRERSEASLPLAFDTHRAAMDWGHKDIESEKAFSVAADFSPGGEAG